ncbi:MAG: hypothetical protein AB1427_21020 [Thermodesulfobacteriota bacterium]
MADIISIEDKLRLTKDKKADLIRKRKISAVHKVFQCTHCSYKCEKCGTQMSTTREGTIIRDPNPRIPYRFCESCTEEYIDFIERLKGGGDPDRYWHNDAWLAVWKSWIDYQSSLDNYLKSKEFLKLLREMKQTTPEQ